MSTTVNNNDASSSSNNAESFDLRMKSMEYQINNLSLNLCSLLIPTHVAQRSHGDSDTKNEQSEDESSNNADVPTDYLLPYLYSTFSEEQKVNLPVGGRLFHHKQVWKELGLPNFCQEVVNGLKVHLLPNFKLMPNPIPFSIPDGPKSDCVTKEVQGLLFDDTIEQETDGRNQESTIDGQTRLLHGKTRYQESLPPHNYSTWCGKGSHYRWKTTPFWLSTPRIFTMLLRHVLRMLRDINVSVIAYLGDLLIVGSTKEECLSNLKKTMDLLVKLGFKLNLEKRVPEPTQSITFLGLQIDSVSIELLVSTF
ncbi:hypothetical protein ACTFIW_000995 [Dictyostelium discoideum]